MLQSDFLLINTSAFPMEGVLISVCYKVTENY